MSFNLNQLSAIIEDERLIHTRNNDSLDKITDILQEELRKDNLTEEDKRQIYTLLYKISDICKEVQLQKPKHVTSRIISSMSIAASMAVSLGTILIVERYKTKRRNIKIE